MSSVYLHISIEGENLCIEQRREDPTPLDYLKILQQQVVILKVETEEPIQCLTAPGGVLEHITQD